MADLGIGGRHNMTVTTVIAGQVNHIRTTVEQPWCTGKKTTVERRTFNYQMREREQEERGKQREGEGR